MYKCKKIRNDNIYINSLKLKKNNYRQLGIDNPYEISTAEMSSTEKINLPDKFKFQPIAYSHCRSIVWWQFSPIFSNDNIFRFKIGWHNGKLIYFYVNILFKMGNNREQDYKNAWEALKSTMFFLKKNFFHYLEPKKEINEDLIKAQSEVLKWENFEDFKPENYTWHHVFMGFQKNPIPNDNFHFLNYGAGINAYVNNFNEDFFLESKFDFKNECENVNLYGIDNHLKATNWQSSYDQQYDEKNWNYKKHLAIMQLVKTEIHGKTVHHVGSNEQRDLYYNQTYGSGFINIDNGNKQIPYIYNQYGNAEEIDFSEIKNFSSRLRELLKQEVKKSKKYFDNFEEQLKKLGIKISELAKKIYKNYDFIIEIIIEKCCELKRKKLKILYFQVYSLDRIIRLLSERNPFKSFDKQAIIFGRIAFGKIIDKCYLPEKYEYLYIGHCVESDVEHGAFYVENDQTGYDSYLKQEGEYEVCKIIQNW